MSLQQSHPATRARAAEARERGATAPVKSNWDFTMDPYMDAAHRGTPVPEPVTAAQGASPASTSGGETGGRASAPSSPEEGLENSGNPLSSDVRVRMEERFGTDLSAIRIHADEQAQQFVQQKGARAFTYKNHIAFAAGTFAPGTPEGDALLAHELTHFLQAGAATGSAATIGQPSAASGTHEAEANRVATQAHGDSAAGEIAPHLTGRGGGEALAGDALRARLPSARAGDAAASVLGQGPQPGYEVTAQADPERRHQCIGGCTPSGGSMAMSAVGITVTQPAVSLSQRGSAEYKVKWSVGGSKNGWVIQHVRFESAVQDTAGTPVAGNNGGLEYWEAWEVRNGSVYVGFASGGAAHSADTFRTINENAKTKGEARIIGKVAFIENYNLATPPWGYTVPAAGSLPTMTSAPAGWNEGGAQDHWMKVNYDDAAGTAQTVTTNP